MAYTTINKSTLHHDSHLYQANGSGKTISGLGFKPDMIWTKNRTTANYIPAIVDSVRGGTKKIFTCRTDAESTDTGAVTSFTSDGYVFGSSGSFNYSTNNYVNWCWKAGGTASTNNDGDNSCSLSANATAGFSVSTHTVPNVGGGSYTIGHGLGKKPKWVMTKQVSTTGNFQTYLEGIGTENQQYLQLNSNAALANHSGLWGSGMTTSVVGLSNTALSAGTTAVTYAWAEIPGYSKFGSYIGNGNADGNFVYTGFKPKWIMLKRTDGTDWWGLWDNKRLGYNPNNYHMRINEETYSEASKVVDQLSNGFKIRETDTAINANGGNYIFMAFGQSIVGSNNTPATAR